MGAIHYYEKERVFKLDTPHTSYLIGIVDEEKFLGHIYYGAKITDYDVRALMRTGEAPFVPSQNNRDRSSFLDAFPMEYPGHGVGDYRESAISVSDKNGNTAGQPLYREHKIYAGKPGLPGLPATFGSEEECETLEIVLADEVLDLTVTLYYTAFYDVDVITRSVRVTNHAKEPVYLTKVFSTALDLDAEDYRMLTLHGSWARERQIEYRQIGYGKQSVGSCRGESSHQEHPFVALVSANAGQEQGRVYGFHFVYSGNFLAQVEKNQFDSLRVVLGIHPQDFKWELKQGETFTAPEVVLTYSDAGLGRMTRTLHDLYRKHLIRSPYKDRERPVLINNWEATYFDFDTEKLLAIAREAKKSGIEMLVMDDGWFGDKYRRVQDNSSLGDWVVDRKKLPNGLENLIQTADRNGIKFGIWIEPEAVNSKSELFEKHPDWALQVKGRPLQYGRGGTQMLLDVCNPEVQDFMFGIVDNLLGKHPQIAYIKWDANVELKNYGSTYLPQDKQSHIYIEYHRGLNKVLERIRAKYPDVLIQACGGGGGRASYGVLPYFDEFWVSDNTDALQRIYMQWGTSYFYPSNAMAQHISASPNHQTGRIIPIKFRCDVAMSGRLGMELQPSKMTKEEYQQTAQAIKDYKSVRDVIQLGNLYRLVSPYDDKGIASLMYTDDTENKAVFFAYKMEHFNNQVIPRVCLRGLDPSKNYRVRELNVKTGGQPCFLNGKTFSGTLLMNTGIEMPLGSDYASCVLELTAE